MKKRAHEWKRGSHVDKARGCSVGIDPAAKGFLSRYPLADAGKYSAQSSLPDERHSSDGFPEEKVEKV